MTTGRFGAKTEDGDGESHATRYVVTWWETDDRGVLVFCSNEHAAPGPARVQFSNIPSNSDPGMVRYTWDAGRNRWEALDMLDRDRGREEQRALNARGARAVRAITDHARGRDRRGLLGGGVKSLDDTLADDNPAQPTKVIEHEPLVTADPSTCIVCDYLCEHGLTPHHPHVPAASVQERF